VKLAQRRGVPLIALEQGTFSGCEGTKTVRKVTVASAGRAAVTAKYAAATLRKGTTTVLDRCTSTKVAVKAGTVEAAPIKKPRAVQVLRAGQSAIFRRG
jgi:ferric-dicitrate binding protein FerR (iron transport regulator)